MLHTISKLKRFLSIQVFISYMLYSVEMLQRISTRCALTRCLFDLCALPQRFSPLDFSQNISLHGQDKQIPSQQIKLRPHSCSAPPKRAAVYWF